MNKKAKKEEQELLHECINCGNEERLVQEYWETVYHTVRKTFKISHASFTEQDVEDLRNDVFIQLLENGCQKLRQYREDKGYSLEGWIRLIAGQTVMMYLRKKDRTGKLGKSSLVSIEEERIKKEFVSENGRKSFETKEMISLILENLEKLNSTEQLVIKLYYFDGLSMKEIAETLQRKIKYIYKVKHNAVKRLKELSAEKIR